MLKFEVTHPLLIDASMLAHRCWKGMPDLTNSKGEPTGLEYGFLRSLESIQRRYPDYQVVLCWDSRTANAEKRKIYPGYKANRTKKSNSSNISDLYKRLEYLRQRVLSCICPSIEAEGQEADDVMFSASIKYKATIIYTNDMDLLQAVNDDVIVVRSHGFKMWEWDYEKVWNKFLVKPVQLPLYRAVVGDKSDELPGAGAFGLRKSSEIVRAAYRREMAKEDPIQALLEEVHDRRNRLTNKMKLAWKNHVESNQLSINYKLMRLVPQPYKEISIVENLGHIVEALTRWEIKTLKLSRRLLTDTILKEEF